MEVGLCGHASKSTHDEDIPALQQPLLVMTNGTFFLVGMNLSAWKFCDESVLADQGRLLPLQDVVW